MEKICWKGKAFKALSYGKGASPAGRNFSGSITIFHRGGGSKKLLRRIDFQRKNLARGVIERIEYDPNRTARIALVRWSNLNLNGCKQTHNRDYMVKPEDSVQTAFSYILACNDLKPGDEVLNIDPEYKARLKGAEPNFSNFYSVEQLYEKSGISLPLWLAPIGSQIHNIELYPGEGGKLVRAAGAYAQLVQKPLTSTVTHGSYPQARSEAPLWRERATVLPYACSTGEGPTLKAASAQSTLDKKPTRIVSIPKEMCTIRLPSGQQQLVDLRCRATIGIVSNIDHGTRALKKAGQTRWRGFRPVVRGVAMNPIDHPHGGGEGRTKGGRPSVSPWGKPTKGHRSNPNGKKRASVSQRR